MKIYEKESHEAKYLCVESGEQFSVLESRLIGNIENHYILRPAAPVGEDGVFLFDITACEQFSDYLVNRKLSRQELISILVQLRSVISTLEDHMLGDANVLLEPEHIYVERSSRKLRFVPVCQIEGGFSVRLRALTGALFMHADMEDPDSLRFAAMMMRASMAEEVHMHELMQLVETDRQEQPKIKKRSRMPESPQRRAQTPADSGRETGRYPDSRTVVSRPREELAMRLSGAQRKEEFKKENAEEVPKAEKEEPGGIRGLLRDMVRGIREQISGDE